jgi:methionyl-tRNA synthetase
MNVCLQTVKTLATLMNPFLPFAAAVTAKMLSLDSEALPWNQACARLPAGRPLGEAQILFRKLLDDRAKG